MAKQLNIFEEETTENNRLSNELEVSKLKVKISDSTFHKKINNLLKRIEKTERRVLKVKEDAKVVYEIYKKEIKPTEEIYFKNKLLLVENLLNFLSKKNIPQIYIEEALHQVNLNFDIILRANALSDEKKQEIIKKLKKVSSNLNLNFESGESKEFNFEMMQGMFAEETGIDLNLDFDDYAHFTIDELEQMFQQKFAEEFHNQQKESLQLRKKKNKEFDNEYFKKLYKSLIKKLHPDLKSDINDEDKKVMILKLTEAWEKRDYLSILEINQVLSGQIDYDQLPEDVLNDFIDSLNTKLKQKEEELKEVRNGETPEYHWYNILYSTNKSSINQNVEKIRKEISFASEDLEFENKVFFKSVKRTKEYLDEFIEDSWLDDDDDDDSISFNLDELEDLEMMSFMEEFIMEEKKKGNNKKKKK